MIATSLGSYRILEKVGAGGMGEVYRAHDARLNRDVALKVLPASFASDPDRLRRFTLEARTAGGLNHPNVLTIYEIASHEGQPFLASELLSGETLRAKLDQGPIPLSKALDYARQTAAGLAAAHARQITQTSNTRQPVRHPRRTGEDSRLRARAAVRPGHDGVGRYAPRDRHLARCRPRHGRIHVAGAHLVEDDAEAEEIRTVIDRLRADLPSASSGGWSCVPSPTSG
jgi:hypothetical protein